ncbi:Hypothetical protein R9X50_00723900 [Acrodontium crateriforme]|uniref:Cyclin-dependent kinase n=1 Tax=Acrodontium crateriforme TaxID=150365 RepID=A0AAQ3RAK9_9PEZI|nr:Hypothetical protein R9X50_00723900 [Acrodontium crateriforme]
MAVPYKLEQPDEVASKVMRRVQVSKMTRTLQDRLALANVKIQNGWEHMSLDLIEPQVEQRVRRKRPASSNDTISDSASTTSSRVHSSSGLGSSPLTAPMYSDDFQRSGSSPSKRRMRPSDIAKFASSGAATGRRQRFTPAHQSWKKDLSLPQSSPIKSAKHTHFHSGHAPQLSFISETSTIPDSPPSPLHSEDDDDDLPVHSFKSTTNATTRIISSPPRTPPPDRRMRKAHNVSWSRTPRTGEEGADLLLYLATSPSTATMVRPGSSVPPPPTTPPSKATPLPSSHMTPGTNGAGFLGFPPTTPGTNFNFADFVNVTPSPAQGSWNRTPVAGRTPAAAREARRKLNFDTLMPPTSSPVMNRNNRAEGLGMELGGELLS